jgi:MFS family permease
MTDFEAARAAPAQRWILASLSLSTLMPSLDTSIANTGLPVLAQSLGATFSHVQWIVLAYLLAITATIVGAGRLGDLLGRRRLLIGGIAGFTLASLACGLAPTLASLIVARALQGLGAAVMLALTVALVGETVPKERTGRTMGLLGSMSAIGTTLGPTLGGLLMTSLGWRAIFLVNVPLGLVNLWLARRWLPRPPTATNVHARFDLPGTLLLALTLAAYALAMTSRQFALLPVAAVAGALFVLTEMRSPAPLVRLAMLREPALATSLATNALVATVIMTTLVVGPFYLSRSLRLPAALVGVVLSAGPLVSALTGAPAGRLVDRLGAARMTAAGLLAMLAGAGALAALPARFGIAGYVGALAVLTAGYATFQAANNAGLMSRVDAAQRGVVSGLLSLSRNLGLITGASAMGAVFAAAAGPATRDPAAVAFGLRATFAVGALLIALALAIMARGRALARRQAAAAARRVPV